jgi:hypothetical protein
MLFGRFNTGWKYPFIVIVNRMPRCTIKKMKLTELKTYIKDNKLKIKLMQKKPDLVNAIISSLN